MSSRSGSMLVSGSIERSVSTRRRACLSAPTYDEGNRRNEGFASSEVSVDGNAVTNAPAVVGVSHGRPLQGSAYA